MGMSSWIMDLEDKYWDTVATIVSESETFQEAESSAKSLAITEVPFLDMDTVSEGVSHLVWYLQMYIQQWLNTLQVLI